MQMITLEAIKATGIKFDYVFLSGRFGFPEFRLSDASRGEESKIVSTVEELHKLLKDPIKYGYNPS